MIKPVKDLTHTKTSARDRIYDKLNIYKKNIKIIVSQFQQTSLGKKIEKRLKKYFVKLNGEKFFLPDRSDGWDELNIWYYRNIKNHISSFYYNLKNGIPQIIYWIPTIYYDRDWDHVYFLKILRKKLIMMAHLHLYHGHLMDNDKYASQMMECVKIINRLINDNYHKVAFEEHDKKWGKSTFWSYPIDDESSSIEITHENCKTKEDEEQRSKEFRKCIDMADKLKQNDLDNLFKLIRENIEYWWD